MGSPGHQGGRGQVAPGGGQGGCPAPAEAEVRGGREAGRGEDGGGEDHGS